MHPLACYLARAGICANKQGGFWKYHDELFRNQKKFSHKFALDLAESKFGWDRNEFLKCINSEDTKQELSREIEAGRRIYLTGTPSLFLNGRRIKNWRDKKFLQKLLKAEIERN
jgi:protein-disulfide isomerase